MANYNQYDFTNPSFQQGFGGNDVSKYLSPEFLIPGIAGLGTSLLGFTNKPEGFSLSVSDINDLIDKYRQAGLEGIKQLGIDERQRATQRLAASGLEPTLALKQSLFNPILQRLSGSRAQLEGSLAGTEGNLLLQRALGQQQNNLAQYQNEQGFLGGLGDLFTTGALLALL